MPDEVQGAQSASPTDNAAQAQPVASVVEPTQPEEETLPADTKTETRERFQHLLNDRRTLKERLAQYEAHGTPEQLQDMRARLQQHDALNERIQSLEQSREPGEAKSTEQVRLETLRKQARTELRELDSGIERGERAASMLESMMSGLEEDALSATVDILKENGLPTSDAAVVRWSKRIASAIADDPRLKRLYYRDPEAAVKKGFAAELAELGGVVERRAAATKQTDKEKLSTLPKPHGGGGPPAQKASEPPQTVAEGIKRSLEILRTQK